MKELLKTGHRMPSIVEKPTNNNRLIPQKMKNLLYRNLAAMTDTLLAALFSAFGWAILTFYCKTTTGYIASLFFALYLIIPILFRGKSVGKALFHIQITFKTTKYTFFKLLLREAVIKVGVFFTIPYFVLVLWLHTDEYLSILYAGIISMLLNNFVYLLGGRKFVWDYIATTSVQPCLPQKRQIPNILKWGANIIDISVIFIIALFFFLGLQRWVFFDFYVVVLAIATGYFLFMYGIFKNTIGKMITGISLEYRSKKSLITTLFIRELLCKFSPAIILLLFSKLIHPANIYYNYYNLIFIFVLYVFLLLWSNALKQRPFWDVCAQTVKIRKALPNFKRVIITVSFLAFSVFAFLGIKTLYNQYPSDGVRFLGIEMYLYNKHHPIDREVQKKVDFVTAHPVSAKDYVLQLFDKYDIVVLGERAHNEMTQWDLFYDIVSDKRFIDKVGNIFTEVGGCTDYQYMADEYFTTAYPDEELLDKATAHLLQKHGIVQMWDGTNIFNFFKKVNLLNQTLPDSLKLHEYYSDPVNAFAADVYTPADYQKRMLWHRDSLMADVIIHKFGEIKQKERRKKCLVITNYRHSFNYTKLSSGPHFRDETSYIFRAFPDITANVFVHTRANVLFNFPINKSTWDKAFELCGNLSCGFDFTNSPFGDDYFDLFFDFGRKKKICYQDIYTGCAYYMPYSKFEFQNGIPYALDNFRDEFKRRCFLRFGDSSNLKSFMEYYESGYKTKHFTDFKTDFYRLNYEIVLSICLLIIGGFICFIALIVLWCNKRVNRDVL